MCTRCLFATLLVTGLAWFLCLPSLAEEKVNEEKIDKLIEQLGSGNFAEREKASKELAAIGAPALGALRKATKSEDAEIRKRAAALLPQIERQAESARILVPKRVHLVYKDTPLDEAVADFQKKSGYTLHLHDPDGKLKERKITLDSGETTFWHAFALFCAKAELTEASVEDLWRPPQPPGAPIPIAPGGGPGGPPAIGRPGRAFPPGMSGLNGQLILKEGKAEKLPTDDRSAARIRVLSKSDLFGTVPEGEILLALEIALEPKLQWQAFQSVHIDTAVDDQGQKLSQIVPQVEGAVGFGGGNPAIALPGGGGGVKLQQQRQMQMQMQMMARQRMMRWGTLSQQIPVQLKKGEKEAKVLKELKGVLTAQVLTEARPLITTDTLDKATGKIFKGEEDGAIKIVSVQAEDKRTTIQLEFEQPPYDKVMPAHPNPLPAPAGAARPKAKLPPAAEGPAAPKPVPVPLGGAAFGGPMQLVDSMNGLSVQDEKGNALPIDGGQMHMQVKFVRQDNGMLKQTMSCTLVCLHDKDKGKPAKVVYLGRKRTTIEIPFVLKDIPLPR
jgi:hypothetical protein